MTKNQNKTQGTENHPYVGVDALILNDRGEILLEKRSKNMLSFSGYWCLPGGWVEWGETMEEAVKREVMEELGIGVEVIKFVGRYYDTNSFPIKKYSRVALPHICKIIYGKPKANQPEEVEEIRWFKLEDALKLELAYDQGRMVADFFKDFKTMN